MIHDDHELTDEQLRLATMRDLPDDAALEATIAAANAAFMSLGSALEAANDEFDEAALVSQLSKLCLAEVEPSSQVALPDRANRGGWAQLYGGVAAAAAMVIAVWLFTADGQTEPDVANAPAPSDAALANVEPTSPRSPSLWHDSLDDEIAFAAATLGQYGGRASGFDDSLFDMNVRLEALSQELDGESL